MICVIQEMRFQTQATLMDIRVISTMGLTDDDVEALSQIEGISGAEPGYMKDVITKQNETDYVVELLSMPENESDSSDRRPSS